MHYIGIDGGGTRTTLALADEAGEIARHTGPPGIVDPRRPLAAAETLGCLVGELLAQAGVKPPVEVLCAGLAGVGNAAEREAVRGALEREGLARRVIVCQDGEIALEGALMGRPGILLVAGTGSVAWGRAEDGRVERCGGWGMVVGDEGSAYALGREGLRAALRAHDGRGIATRLGDNLLESLGLCALDLLPAWAGKASKSMVAALAIEVVRLAEEGDEVSTRLVVDAAEGIREHASALMRRLAPWLAPVPVVLHGGLATQAFVAEAVRGSLERDCLLTAIELRSPIGDAVSGALWYARTASSSEASC